jgi:hypothetical protein
LRQAYDYWQNQPDCYLTLAVVPMQAQQHKVSKGCPFSTFFGVIYDNRFVVC